MKNKIVLSPKKLLNKRFEIKFKGYNCTEVDAFLDIVKSDYESFKEILNEMYERNEQLEKELKELKEKTMANPNIEPKVNHGNINNNVDLLKRLSQLEKEVYNKKEQ